MNDVAQLPFKPTTKLIVKLYTEGVQLLNPAVAQPFPLKFHNLVTISELQANDYSEEEDIIQSVTEKTGAKGQDVAQFIKSMIKFGRLRRRRIPIPVRALTSDQVNRESDVSSIQSNTIILNVPLALRLCDGRYQIIDHDGCLVESLDAAELTALGEFVRPLNFSSGLEKQKVLLGENAVEELRLLELLGTLATAGFISVFEQREEESARTPVGVGLVQALKENFSRQARELDEREASREQQTGVYRPKIIPVSFGEAIPAALGLVFAYAKAYENGCLDDFYNFRLDWVWDDARFETFAPQPAIYLFSNYLWTHEKGIGISENIKLRSPGSITIHGGPDTPKYEEDAKAYFEKFPHVDIIIRGEGEATAAEALDKLRTVIGQEQPDFSVLEGVEGVSYRYKGEIFRNPDRPRIADLDTIPSPYLMGLFDAYEGVPFLHVTLETNRGCPYGCTFCDWGSATTSKIRKFDIDRVFGELEWCSRMKVQSVSQADANFGVFERDVHITERVAQLKTNTGYPETFGGSYAKNSTKYLQTIIKLLADAGILAQGVLSLQTMDADTLKVINRENIKVEKYDALANEMRNSNLQLTVELMMGLPGSTRKSFFGDLQQCIDRDIPARINHTTMLVNSPMNNPKYREENQIETGTELAPGKMPVLVSTKSFSREDIEAMAEMRQVYLLLDNFGVLRLVSRFVRQQVGMEEIDFYQKLIMSAGRDNQQHIWPLLNVLINQVQHLMAPPYSWALLFAELREFLVQECGVPDDSALDVILSAQRAVLPSHDRSFPQTVELEHDVVEWHSQMLQAKEEGHWADWHTIVPPLSSFGPGRLEVNDVDGNVTKTLGCQLDLTSTGVNWDLDSGVARARVALAYMPGQLSQKEDVIQVG